MKDFTDLLSNSDLAKIENFPFSAVLSFHKLLAQWEEMAESDNPIQKQFATQALSFIQKEKDLIGPIRDTATVQKHFQLVEMMMMALFPKAGEDKLYAAVAAPFGALPIYATPAMQGLLQGVDFDQQAMCNMDLESLMQFKTVFAALLILEHIYGYEGLQLDNPVRYDIPAPDGTIRHFKITIDIRFADVILKGKKQKITREQVDAQLKTIEDAQGWLNLLDPDLYEFQGFVIMNWTDISEEVNFSEIQQNLLEANATMDPSKMDQLQDSIRNFMAVPDLQMGIALLDSNPDGKPRMSYSRESMVAACDGDKMCPAQFGSVYRKMVESGRPYLVTDLEDFPNPTPMEISLLRRGIRNIMLTPIWFEDEMIGYLELYTKEPNKLNTLSQFKIRRLIPTLAIAMKQAKEAMNNEVEATIREKFTAIHPVVEWKFTEAATNYMEAQAADENVEIDEILFDQVYPLYGQSDIRSSTVKRNQAVQEDLGEQLRLAQNVLKSSYQLKKLPLIEEMEYLIGKHRSGLKRRLNANDESIIQNFLKKEVEPVFEHLEGEQPELAPDLATYRAALDPAVGFVTARRRQYELSLTKLNDHIANQIEQHQAEAQDVFPHYFEKYKTDGVEYNMYIGQSLVPNREFHRLYLKNLRLWQLISMAKIAVENERLRHSLPVPLQTAQLILVHPNPLDIRFRMDEKRFDVDGAYNIRYEIIKKRIDKAVIAGSGERITAAGKLTIVLEQESDSAEYMRYIEFLQSRGVFAGKVEDFRLEPMQGIQGMRALRVSVNLDLAETKDIDLSSLLEEKQS